MMKVYQRFIYVVFIMMTIFVFVGSVQTSSAANEGANYKAVFYVQ